MVSAVLGGIYSAYRTVSKEYGVLLSATKNILTGLQGLMIIAANNPAVKLALSIADLVKGVFETIATLPNVHEMATFRSEFFEAVPDSRMVDLKRKKIKVLTKSCTYIVENEKRIRKILGIAKDAGLITRANEALAGLSTGRDEEVQKAEAFILKLRQRTNAKYGLSIGHTVNKVSGVGVSISLIAAGPNPVSLSLMGLVGVSALGLWAYEKIMLPADPFRGPKDVWYETVPHKVRTALYSLSDRIKSFFTPKRVTLFSIQ